MEHYQLSARELADICGVQRSAISHIMNGRNRPSVSFLMALSDAYPEMNTRWLLHGKGSMITNVNTNVNKLQAKEGQIANTSQDFSNQRESGDQEANKEFTKVNTSVNSSSEGKAIKQVIVLYQDGSFEAFSPSEDQSV